MSDIHPGQMAKVGPIDPRLVGIRGWLILPAIGLVVSTLVPALLAYVGLVCVRLGVINVRRLLSSFLREIVNPDYGVYVLSVMVAAGILYLCFCITCGRFFKKTKSAPRSFVRLLVLSFAVSLYLFVLRLLVFGVDDVSALTIFLRACDPLARGIAAAIWIPYFKVSRRVKATFVKEDNPCLPYKIVLPIRYLIYRRISWLAFTAVALCVFIVVIVLTVMNGLVGDFKQKNHEFVGDCVVGTKSLVGFPYYEELVATLERAEFVEAVSPVVKNYALLRPEGGDRSRGVEIMGLDPVRHSRTTNFGQTLHYRASDAARAFAPVYEPNAVGCVLGIDLALWRNAQSQYTYDAQPARIALALTCFPLNSRGAPAKAGTVPVNTQRFYYSDHSHTGIARVDGSTVYIPLERAQALCMAGASPRVTAVHVKFRPDTPLEAGRDRVAALWDQFRQNRQDAADATLLETVTVETWKEYRRAFIAPMEKEEAMLCVMFGFVGITTVFIVFVVFYMIISHTTRDIGVLKSVGASSRSVLALFSGFAVLVAVLGAGVGIHYAWLFLAKINPLENWLFERFDFQLWDRTIYAIGEIPHRVDFGLLAVVVCCAIVACLIGALVPGYCAARLRPVETLHGSRT